MGILAFESGSVDLGVVWFSRARLTAIHHDKFWISCIRALVSTGKGREASLLADEARQFLDGHGTAEVDKILREAEAGDPSMQDVMAVAGAFDEGRYGQVIELTRGLTARYPRHVYFWKAMGAALQRLGMRVEAAAVLETALILDPADFESWVNLGVARRESGHSARSTTDLTKAARIRPYDEIACNNLGGALQDMDDSTGAALNHRRAVCLNPGYAEAMGNLAVLLLVEAPTEALRHHQRAVAADPGYVDGQVNYSLALLATGDYLRGWQLNEWRFRQPAFVTREPLIDSPRLTEHQSFVGKVVLLQSEQGYGDTLQFCRYVKLVRDLGAKVILTLPRALTRLLASQGWGCEIMSLEEARGVHDYHCPMLSLPMVFGTTLETIPSSEEAYLHASSVDVERWRERLGVRDRLRVGVVWNGGFRPDQPELWAVNARRNVPLELFSRHLDIEGVDFFSLQKGDPAESEIRGREGEYWRRSRLYNYATELNDFADTAGLIANLDLVISVDTSTAHLAAAMGKPTWILNRYDTCWRWLLDRDDSPWYASVKLYRQHQNRDWIPVLERINRDLRMVLATSR